MQEQTVSATPLRVWPFTVASATTALVVGILAIPIHIVKHMAHGFDREMGMPRPPEGGVLPPGAMPGGPMMPGGPGAEMHGAWAMHAGLGIEWAIVGLIVVAVYAGVAGAVFASVYNALLARRATAR